MFSILVLPWASEANGADGDAACARAGRWRSAPAPRLCRAPRRIDQPPTWITSVNASFLGEYLDRESAMARLGRYRA